MKFEFHNIWYMCLNRKDPYKRFTFLELVQDDLTPKYKKGTVFIVTVLNFVFTFDVTSEVRGLSKFFRKI